MIKISSHNIRLLKSFDKFVFGISGGPDSIACAHFLSKKLHINNFICVYVDHNIHENSSLWGNFCENFCCNHSIPFERISINLPNTKNIESIARELRYKTLSKFSKHIVIAHHGDDFYENLFFGLVRKKYITNWSLKEISHFPDYTIIRPFLRNTKEDILNYCKNNNLSFVIDDSNEDISFDRNFLRKIVKKLKIRFKTLDKPQEIIELFQTVNECCKDLAYQDIENYFTIYSDKLIIDTKMFKNKPHRFVNSIIVFSQENHIHFDKNTIKELKNQLNKKEKIVIEL